jgi:hypothetical protein
LEDFKISSLKLLLILILSLKMKQIRNSDCKILGM